MMHPLDLLFPPRCPFCGCLLASGQDTCDNCAKNLPAIKAENILRKIGNHTCIVTFYYEGCVREAIHALKFRRRPARARMLAPYLVRTIAGELGGSFDAVTYVPISAARRRRRGFDQTRLLASCVCAAWGVQLEKTLFKFRNNPPQSAVKTAQARRENVKNVFRIVPGARVAGRRFLLIDDLTTSGSTFAVCAELLMAAGAASVVCAALAGGHSQK